MFAFASTMTAVGPINPATGSVCTPGTSVPPSGGFTGACIDGAPIQFNIFKATLTSPTPSDSQWHLEILTNYGPLGSQPTAGNPGGYIPGGSTSIPTYSYEGKQFGMADFLIKAGSNFYGIVLTPHDGYTAGNLYQASGFQTSQQVMGPQGVLDIPRPSLPALLTAGGGAPIGVGALTAGPNGGDGITSALYKISVAFAAPVNFLSSSNFTVYAASYVCDNGYLTAGFDAVTPPPPPSGVPEPPTWTLMIPAVVAIAMRKFRKR